RRDTGVAADAEEEGLTPAPGRKPNGGTAVSPDTGGQPQSRPRSHPLERGLNVVEARDLGVGRVLPGLGLQRRVDAVGTPHPQRPHPGPARAEEVLGGVVGDVHRLARGGPTEPPQYLLVAARARLPRTVAQLAGHHDRVEGVAQAKRVELASLYLGVPIREKTDGRA